MTIHYHGTPITPRSVLYELAGRNFCVRYGEHRDVEVCHQIGQSVMLDNGAFSAETTGKSVDWDAFYEWADHWTAFHTTWTVIPDVINGTEAENDELLSTCWLRERQVAPVWHLHESFERLWRLIRDYEKVCFGSSREFWQIGSPTWNNRMNETFNLICRGSGHPPIWIHMLRGMSLSGSDYPFASVDSTDIARNHEQVNGKAAQMAQAWDAKQCPGRWINKPIQQPLESMQ